MRDGYGLHKLVWDASDEWFGTFWLPLRPTPEVAELP